jgi:hypothetical protein
MSQISFQQAQFIKENKTKAERYSEQINECIMFFSQNTFLQIPYMSLISELYSLSSYYHDKDYSQFLFDKTDAALEEVNKIKEDPKFQQAKENMIKAAQLMTQIRQKEQNEKQNNSSNL